MNLKEYFNQAFIHKLAELNYKFDSRFNKKVFTKLASKNLKQLSLKERVNQIAKALKETLHGPFEQQNDHLLYLLTYLSGFAVWPLTTYVEQQGLSHPSLSLDLLKEMTKRFTSEFAIRAFIEHHPELTFKILHQWKNDPCHHVRRLVSEGTRPLLPWGKKLNLVIKNPHLSLELLETLKDDDSLYVRKSVANHLNDLTKTQPDLVIKTLQIWKKTAKNQEQFIWITKHALRSEIKNGNPKALRFLGFKKSDEYKISNFKLTPSTIKRGSSIEFCFQIQNTSNKKMKLMIDYEMDFPKKNDRRTQKVFKLKSIELSANESLVLSKKHSFKEVTVRTYYPGEHQLTLIINGIKFSSKKFNLV